MSITRLMILPLLAWAVVQSTGLVAAPTVVAQGRGKEAPQQPQVAVAPDGAVELVFGVGDAVFHSRSVDGGKSFSAPAKAFACSNLSLGMRRGPRVAVSGDTVVVSAIGGEQGKGRDGDLQAWRMQKGGKWLGPVRVNDAADTAREGLHAMASGSDGTLWCAWLDLRHQKTEIYASRSSDHGATWEENVLVYQSPDGSVCECCHPSIAVDAKGIVQVMFRNSLAGHRDMYLCSSSDGQTFSAPVKLGAGNWELDACPMDGGMLAIGRSGKVVTVWRRNREVFSATADADEQRLGMGEQPWVTMSASGPVTVWTTKRDGEGRVQVPHSRTSEAFNSTVRDPVVITLAEGENVLICWESVSKDARLLLSTVLPSSASRR